MHAARPCQGMPRAAPEVRPSRAGLPQAPQPGQCSRRTLAGRTRPMMPGYSRVGRGGLLARTAAKAAAATITAAAKAVGSCSLHMCMRLQARRRRQMVGGEEVAPLAGCLLLSRRPCPGPSTVQGITGVGQAHLAGAAEMAPRGAGGTACMCRPAANTTQRPRPLPRALLLAAVHGRAVLGEMEAADAIWGSGGGGP